MRRQHDRVSRFDSDDYFIDRCRGWIGRGNDRCNNAARTCDLDDAARIVNDSDSFEIPEIVPYILGSEPVLFTFVLGLSKPGLFVCEFAETGRLRERDPRHRVTYFVDL